MLDIASRLADRIPGSATTGRAKIPNAARPTIQSRIDVTTEHRLIDLEEVIHGMLQVEVRDGCIPTPFC